MKKLKRLTALMLAAFLVLTSGYYDVAAAAAPNGQTAETEMQESKEEQEVSDTEAQTTETEVSVPESTETADAQTTVPETTEEVTTDVTETESTETADTEISDTKMLETEILDTEEATESLPEEETEQEEPAGLVNWAVVDSPVVNTPGTQHVMTSIGDGEKAVKSAVLRYQNKATKEEIDVPAAEILGDFVIFSMEFQDESLKGTYILKSITYTLEDVTTTTTFQEMGMDIAFGVNQEVDTAPDDVLLTDEELAAISADTSMSVVSIDENGRTTSEESLDGAIANAENENAVSGETRSAFRSAEKGVDATGMKSIAVVLDPGHGGTDGGASANNIVEKVVNLKIAQYCKEELEQYNGVTVHMTRSSDVYVSLQGRVDYAASVGADIFVSLHNNSNNSSAPNGANVYYPNSNYNASCGATGAELARIIESNLTDLGLASGGIHIRNTEANTKYPDGSPADYYAVIRGCKERQIPAIIVEHAFISNASDAANYLSSDEKLKKLGIADAKGIAQYYGLKKGIGFSSVQSKSSTSIQLDWKVQTGVTGYEVQRSISSASGFATVATIEKAATASWMDTGLAPGTTYYYRMRTYTGSGSKKKYSSWSSVESGTTMQVPVIVSIKSESSKKLKLTWNGISNAKNYEIYRSTSENGTYSKVTTVNGINNYSYLDGSVKADKKYYYKIRAIGSIDNSTAYSDYSLPVSGRTAPVPSGKYAKSKDSNRLRVYWKGSDSVTGYVLYRSSSKNGSFKKIATIKDSKASYYDDKTVSAGKTYYYKIQSYNHNNGVKGYSGKSSAFYGKTVKKASISLIESISSTKLKISWKKVSGATGYDIYRSTSKKDGYKKIKTISSSGTISYTDSGLKSGNTYYYKIRTRNKVNKKTGYGSYSTVRSAPVIKKASIVKVTGAGATKIKVSWKAVTGTSGYDIYRSTSEKGTYKKVGSASKSAVDYTDSKLKMTKKYYYKIVAKVKGYKKNGDSGYSKAVGGYPTRKTAITSVAGNDAEQLVVTWNKVPYASGYEVYRSTSGNDSYKLIKTYSGSKDVSYTDTDIKAGNSYYYKIRVISKYSGKKIYGSYSNEVEGKILNAPANTAVTSVSVNQLDITWSPVSEASGYEVYRSTDINGTYTAIAAIGSGTTVSYSDTTVSEGVTYYYKIKAIDQNGHISAFSSAASGCAVAKIAIKNLAWDASGKSITLTWTGTPEKITGYELYRSSSENVTQQIKVAATTSNSYADPDVKPGVTYYYRVRTYIIVNGKTTMGVFSDTVSSNPSDFRIMGSPSVTAAQMAKMYKASVKLYPSSVYASKGASDIETFCNIVYEESQAEGIKPEVVFAQICHETAYLQFGGQVQVAQCNFGGLGATDDGASGGVFADVRTGVRTQVQHMKAYASTDPLKNICIDSRFAYVIRGKAEYVQQLGNGNWATDTAYAIKMMNYINKIKNA